MAMFITRIELHGAKSEDYENLHGYMGQQGFNRCITAIDGNHYQLPTAEYLMQGNIDDAETFRRAKSAADQTKKSNWILVSEITRLRFELAPCHTQL